LTTLNGLELRGRHIDVSVATVRRERPHMELKGTQQAPGTRSPAMLAEIVALLVRPDPNGIYIDGTFGRGGHDAWLARCHVFEGFITVSSRASSTAPVLGTVPLLPLLSAFDMDHEGGLEFRCILHSFTLFLLSAAIAAGEALSSEDSRLIDPSKKVFGKMAKVLKDIKGSVLVMFMLSSSFDDLIAMFLSRAGVLLDLGISSPQLDDPTQWHATLSNRGPLDWRFDVTRGIPAWRYLETASREDICAVLARYGDGQDAALLRG